MGITQTRGRAAEAMAAAYLELIGCRLLARNVRRNGVEVDVVALDGRTQVVVEVRCRNRADFGSAAETIDHEKRRRLIRAVHAIAGEHAGPVRIDVIAIDVGSEGATLRHYRNAIVD
jgi:putative endonuclease